MAGRPLILLQTFPPDLSNGRIAAVETTWLKEWGHLIEHRFAFDNTLPIDTVRENDIVLDAPTGLMNTSLKVAKAIKWALESSYTHAFVIPTDCYVAVPRLLASGYGDHDYTGFHSYDEHHIGGGSGYWLSRRAMQAVAAYVPYSDYEDRWVGSACREAGLVAVHDARYRSWEQPPVEGAITKHLSRETGSYDPLLMSQTHEKFMQTGDLT